MTTTSRHPTAQPASPTSATPRPHRLARLHWSLIAEPTDPVAQLARAVLGPEAALDLARDGSATDVLEHLGERLPAEPSDPSGEQPMHRAQRALERWRRRLENLHIGTVLSQLEEHRIRVIVPADPDWPSTLHDLGTGTPPCLYLRGGHADDLRALLQRPALAVVGSRASTAAGEDVAASLGAGIAARGHTVISGGAYGIDSAAHRGALADGQGRTAAVLACGLDRLYPTGNARLLERLTQESVVISESPPGTAPTRWRFLARNRLIAALAGAAVVVEAAHRSGALSTARWADDLSRPVGAVPGPVTSAASAGCHRLIRERGAVLVTDAAQALELLPGGDPVADGRIQDELDLLEPADRRVLDAVPPRSRRSIDELALDIGASAADVQAALGRLHLLGMVEVSQGRARRTR